MRLRSHSKTETWDLSDTAVITYRPATSLDVDIAQAAAAGYGKMVLSADVDARLDFGFVEADQATLLATLTADMDDFTAYAEHFFAVALAERIISGFDGFVDDETEEPLPMSRASFARLFRDPDLQKAWLKRALAPVHERDKAGNA